MASETITVCENICRDFSWLGEWMPALLAASVALLIAFGAYSWQKKKDRELQLQLERRSLYGKFARTSREAINEVKFGKNPEKVFGKIHEFEVTYAEFLMAAKDTPISEATSLRAAFYALTHNRDQHELRANCEMAFFKCLVAMRKDVFEGTSVASELLDDPVAEKLGELYLEKNQ